MSTMRAAVLRAFRDVVVEEVPLPTVEPGGLLVATRACGICPGDVMPWYIERKAPLVLGHEPVGVVVEAPGSVAFTPGDRVFVHHHAPCLTCEICRRGDHVHCPTWKLPAIKPGGCAQFFTVTPNGAAHDTLRLPDTVSDEAGCLIEPLACCVKGFARVPKPALHGTTLVLGLGPMGLLNIRLARHYGAHRIIAVDRVPFRLALAKSFGATVTVDFSREDVVKAVRYYTGGAMADLIIVGPPQVDVLQTALDCAAPGATVLQFSPVTPGQMLAIDPNRLYFGEVRLVPSYSCGPDDTRQALTMLADGLVDLGAFISHRFLLNDAAKAYATVADGGDSAKVIVTI